MNGTARTGLACWLLLATACGGAPAAPGFRLHDTTVVVESEAPFVQQPDFEGRVESTVGAALDYWGGSWADLAGATITLVDRPSVACGDVEAALGCWEGRSIRLTTRDPGVGLVACVEQTVLVHEVGHVVLGDAHHRDPRWMDLEPVSRALAGRVGYTQDGERMCDIHVSVWRHVLGLP